MSKISKAVKEKTLDELRVAVADSRTKLLKLNLKRSVTPLENHGELKTLRRSIARMETAITAKSKSN